MKKFSRAVFRFIWHFDSFRYSLRGFGLLETLLAVGVLITVVGAAVSLGTAAVRAGQDSADRQIAVNLANEGIELVRQTRDTRWNDNDALTTWRNESSSTGGYGFCTQFPNTGIKYQCGQGLNERGKFGRLELFYGEFGGTVRKWRTMYCSSDADPNQAVCNDIVREGGTLGEEGKEQDLSIKQDGTQLEEKICLVNDNTFIIIDNNHGPNNNKRCEGPDVVRQFDRIIRLRTVSNGSLGLKDLQLPNGNIEPIGDKAIQVVVRVNWANRGRTETVETSTLLTAWNE